MIVIELISFLIIIIINCFVSELFITPVIPEVDVSEVFETTEIDVSDVPEVLDVPDVFNVPEVYPEMSLRFYFYVMLSI